MRQWQEAKDLHPDKLLLFRMGDFYEMFNEDAVRGAKLLGLTLTKRGRDGNAPALAGVPHHQLDRYVKELVEKGVSIAICDQLEDPAQAKGVVKRGITRVITPGTLVDESVLPLKGNNYLAAVAVVKKDAGMAVVDLSTGEFYTLPVHPDHIEDELARHGPAETLVARELANDSASPLSRALKSGLAGGVTRRDSYQFDPHEGETRLKNQFKVKTLSGLGLEGKPACIGAAGAVLAYLEENQATSLDHLKEPYVRDYSHYMLLDRNAISDLELIAAPRGNKEATLLSVIDKTLTGPGSRLLRDWLLRPLVAAELIRPRREAVEEFMIDAAAREVQLELFAPPKPLDQLARELTMELAKMDVNRLTPLDAHAVLAKLSEKAAGK